MMTQVGGAAEQIYKELLAAGIDVLLDDRDARGGVKFKDADLLGIPVRVTIGKKSIVEGNVEIKLRSESENKKVPFATMRQKKLSRSSIRSKRNLMWQTKKPKPVKLIIGIFAADADCLQKAVEAVTNQFGQADLISDVWPFDKTDYYKEETGEHILRQFVSIEKLIDPGELAANKAYDQSA